MVSVSVKVRVDIAAKGNKVKVTFKVKVQDGEAVSERG